MALFNVPAGETTHVISPTLTSQGVEVRFTVHKAILKAIAREAFDLVDRGVNDSPIYEVPQRLMVRYRSEPELAELNDYNDAGDFVRGVHYQDTTPAIAFNLNGSEALPAPLLRLDDENVNRWYDTLGFMRLVPPLYDEWGDSVVHDYGAPVDVDHRDGWMDKHRAASLDKWLADIDQVGCRNGGRPINYRASDREQRVLIKHNPRHVHQVDAGLWHCDRNGDPINYRTRLDVARTPAIVDRINAAVDRLSQYQDRVSYTITTTTEKVDS
jgi:hypothetical protein